MGFFSIFHEERDTAHKSRVALTPSPTPEIRAAMVYSKDLLEAAQRLHRAWNRHQLEDAISSIERHIAAMRAAIDK
ncbi:hypothetical protein [Chromobacterium haemolyticum]|uniref:hypothetical protein n=1 Tax=Chromobacterium haemolyticum TaxID=394935 RepID=UPI000594D7F8|nr:hypothetical protein [Chromobacterium haemolyticum]